MILAGHQPEYIPYIGFFAKAAQADAFIFVDHVQFLKKSFQNRNKIRVAPGSEGWTLLTVPIVTAGKRFQKINEVEVDNSTRWSEKHWKTILLNYGKTPYFSEHKDFFEELYMKQWNKLVDLNEDIIRYLFRAFGINIPLFRSSDYDFKGAKTDLLVEMCDELKANTYLSGIGAKIAGYVEDEKFARQGLCHAYSNFRHPDYRQIYKPFIPCLSAIDLLFNYGEESKKIIREASL